MTQHLNTYKSSCPALEMDRLVTYIAQNTIDSEQSLIQPDEIPAVVDCLIQRLIWQHSHVDQVLQEILDDLRFKV